MACMLRIRQWMMRDTSKNDDVEKENKSALSLWVFNKENQKKRVQKKVKKKPMNELRRKEAVTSIDTRNRWRFSIVWSQLDPCIYTHTSSRHRRQKNLLKIYYTFSSFIEKLLRLGISLKFINSSKSSKLFKPLPQQLQKIQNKIITTE